MIEELPPQTRANHDEIQNEGDDAQAEVAVVSIQGKDSESRKAVDTDARTGELDTYWYYFRSIGFGKFSIFVMFCAMNVFCSCFSRKYSFTDLQTTINTNRDLQRYGSSGGQMTVARKLDSASVFMQCSRSSTSLATEAMSGKYH